MNILKFTLSGKTAFFKRPDINQKFYFTFSNIHKIALLGLFGCILGLNGYNNQTEEDEYPEFYKELKGIQVSIVPKGTENGIFKKKIQGFNNAVGYAYRKKKKEDSSLNLMINEQVLENVEWDIFILNTSPLSQKLIDNIKNNKTIFTPYLGKNEHLANITNVETITLEKNYNKNVKIISLALSKEFTPVNDTDEDNLWYVRDRLPISLDKDNYYIMEDFVHTNSLLKRVNEEYPVYQCKYGNIVFI